MRATDALAVPDCTVVRGAGARETVLAWPDLSAVCARPGGQVRPLLVGTAPGSAGPITVTDLGVQVTSGGFGQRCAGAIGAHGGAGHTFARLNVTVFDAEGPALHTFAPAVMLEDTTGVLVEGCTFLHCGNSTSGAHPVTGSPILTALRVTAIVARDNLWQVGLAGWHIDQSWHVVFESNVFTAFFDNKPARPLPNMDGSFWFSSYVQGAFPGAGRFFYGNTTQNERGHTKPQVGGGESFTLDGGNSGGFYGPVASAAADGTTVTAASDVCWDHVGGWAPANCTTSVSRWPGGRTGHAALILTGPGRGQWRRVVGVGGERNRTVRLDAPFDPAPTAESTLQIGPFRGQVMIVGGMFIKGGGVQMYAACYDCVVAENTFERFGFTSWGRNPHGSGWQPNLNNLVADNAMLGPTGNGSPMGVTGCSHTCSDAQSGHCEEIRPSRTCSGNATSLPGRDCVPFARKGEYGGAVNLQVAWRRNAMSSVRFGPDAAPPGFEVVDGGVVEHTRWLPAAGSPPAPLDLGRAANVLVRD